MTERMKQPSPQKAAATLDDIGRMTRAAVQRGLHPRWFAVFLSLWVGAMTGAKSYNGPAADVGIVALLVAGVLGFALWRRGIVARVRAVHGAVGTVTALALLIGMLVILAVGDRAFEVHHEPWAPVATGGLVAALLFMAFEVVRRATRARFGARDA